MSNWRPYKRGSKPLTPIRKENYDIKYKDYPKALYSLEECRKRLERLDKYAHTMDAQLYQQRRAFLEDMIVQHG